MITLPELREELTLYPGAASFDGSPTWIIHDPMRNRFFSIGKNAFEILSRWREKDVSTIVKNVNLECSIPITNEDIKNLSKFLLYHELAQPIGEAGTHKLIAEAKKWRHAWYTQLLHNYLFFKIPLIRPNSFLTHTEDLVRWAYSKWFHAATLFALALGTFSLTRQWETFFATLVDTISWSGIIRVICALIIIKIIHEFAHAYTAKRYNCRVPSMGVAFLVLWPMPYTDTTDVWKLSKRKHRMAVGAAGMIAELIVASWATLAWGFLPPGSAREIAFLLATTTWISSLIINISPFLRFDGYYILSDWLRIDNLHSRSFGLAKWWLREKLFNLDERPPEKFDQSRMNFLILFALFVWIYRLILFLSIAIFVYYFFIKILGILLFAIEIIWFIIFPIHTELRQWNARKKTIFQKRRVFITISCFVFFVVVGLMPWRGNIVLPALLRSQQQVGLYAPAAGQLEKININEGTLIKKDSTIFSFKNPNLDHQLALTNAQTSLLEYELEASQLGSSWQDETQTLFVKLQKSLAETSMILEKKAQLQVKAPFYGWVTDVEPTLNEKQWINVGQRLATMRGQEVVAIAYAEEGLVSQISPGANCFFYAESGYQNHLSCKVSVIEKTAIQHLPERELSSSFGGSLRTRVENKNLITESSYYRIRLTLDKKYLPLSTQLRGVVSIKTAKQIPLSNLFKSILAVLIRESGF